jgi:hypothetical protein
MKLSLLAALLRELHHAGTYRERERECVPRCTFPSDRALTKPSVPNLRLLFILDCIPTVSPPETFSLTGGKNVVVAPVRDGAFT